MEDPVNLNVPENARTLSGSENDSNSIFPSAIQLQFYRGGDENGNHYFLTKRSSELLSDAIELFLDGTFAPVRGLTFFEQLFIFSVKEKLPDGNFRVHPCAFIYMTNRTYENYLLVFSKIKQLVNSDIEESMGIFEPDFIMADAELATRKAALQIWPNCQYQFCLFHQLQAIRRRLLKVPGMKVMLEAGPGFSKSFSEFWHFLAGMPMLHVTNDKILSKTIRILNSVLSGLLLHNSYFDR